jgi:hypothetical protein
MNDCIDRPDTRLHPTNASEAQFATCNAGAIHTRRVAPSRANIWSSLVAALNGRRCLRQGPILRATVAPPDAADALIAAPAAGLGCVSGEERRRLRSLRSRGWSGPSGVARPAHFHAVDLSLLPSLPRQLWSKASLPRVDDPDR